MKLLIYGLNYFPELTGIGKYTGEMAEWLAMRGHTVRVITVPPYYPDWKIGADYSGWRYQREKIHDVDVWRCPLWVPAQVSGRKRILHLMSFAVTSLPVLLQQSYWKPDVIMVIAPDIFCAPAGWLAKHLGRAKAWLHIQDFEIDTAFELGFLKNRHLQRIVSAAEGWLMQRFDRVSTISPRMLDRLSIKGVSRNRQVLFPNWVAGDEVYPLNHTSVFRQEMDIPDQAIVALYSGNMGQKQGLDLVLSAAGLLQENKNIHFVLCGQGAAYRHLRRIGATLRNVSWLPLQPIGRLNELLNLADIHLLPQRANVKDLVMPSKLTGMLASGRPVLATASEESQLATILCTCGIVVPAGDIEAFASALIHLSENLAGRKKLGENARRYAMENLEKHTLLSEFETLLGQWIQKKT